MKLWLSIKTNGPGGQIMSCAMVREDGKSFLWIEQVINEKIHRDAKQAWDRLGHRPLEITPLFSTNTKLVQVMERYLSGVDIVYTTPASYLAYCHEALAVDPERLWMMAKPESSIYKNGWTAGNAWCDAMAMREASLVA